MVNQANSNSANAQQKILLSADGEVSKKDIRLIKQRFLNLHKLRLSRVKESISPRQHIFLDLLPLLFHVNHPILPGYISSLVPAGIPDYSPSKQVLTRAKTLGKGFLFRKRALRIYPIEGIYLMGSVGSIAHSSKSDLDIWLCHSPHLSDQAIESLQTKASAIEKWADSFDLEVHFFLIDSEKFRQGASTPMSSESSGSTQHKLLLEEFYRTALYIAGRYPAWWLVPPAEERNYTEFLNHLITLRFIDPKEIIDFGGLEEVPAREFLGASLWHLYKAIDSPYKSLLKLYLMETYVEQYPNSHWASLKMKKAIYDGQVDANSLDAYVILYRLIEQHFLDNNHPERLDLMRYCFYNKVNESRQLSRGGSDWRNEALNQIVNEWGQLEGFLQDQMQARIQDIHQIQEERQRLTRELTYSYRLLTRFAHDHVQLKVEDDEELRLLGRKLRASLEKRPGKIDRVTTRQGRIKIEPTLQIKQIPMSTQEGWAMYKQDANGSNVLLRRAYCVLDILTWALDMGIVDNKTAFALDPGTSHIDSREIQQGLRDIRQFLQRIRSEESTLDAFRDSPYITHASVILNSGLDPLSELSQQGAHLTSERSDSLSFGSKRKNLIHTLDVLYCNSWKEVVVQRFKGIEGLLECMGMLIEASIKSGTKKPPIIDFNCYTSARASSISHRINSLFEQATKAFRRFNPDCSPRFVLQAERMHYVLQMRAEGMHFWCAEDAESLQAELAMAQPTYSPVLFDEHALTDSPLPVIYRLNKPDRVQIFYSIQGNLGQIFLLDERGSLHARTLNCNQESLLLAPYSEIIESSEIHRQLLQGEAATVPSMVEYYALARSGQQWSTQSLQPMKPSIFQRMEVRILYDEQSASNVLYCNDREFSSMEYGADVFTAAAQFIREQRQSKNNYPVYITDIDVPPSVMGAESADQLQTIHYVEYKQKIENRLNV